jgi:hypothetical protein
LLRSRPISLRRLQRLADLPQLSLRR